MIKPAIMIDETEVSFEKPQIEAINKMTNLYWRRFNEKAKTKEIDATITALPQSLEQTGYIQSMVGGIYKDKAYIWGSLTIGTIQPFTEYPLLHIDNLSTISVEFTLDNCFFTYKNGIISLVSTTYLDITKQYINIVGQLSK